MEEQINYCSYGWAIKIDVSSFEDPFEQLDMMVEFNEFNMVPIDFNCEGTLAFLDCNRYSDEQCDITVVGDQFGNVEYLFNYLDSFDVPYDKESVQPYFSNWTYNEQDGIVFNSLYEWTLEQFEQVGNMKCSLKDTALLTK